MDISSLKAFFDKFTGQILDEVNEGCKKNQWGYLVDKYMSLYAHKDNLSGKPAEIFTLLESFVGITMTIDDVITVDEHSLKFSYTITDEERLRELEQELNIKKAANQFLIYNEMSVIHFSNILIMLVTKFEEYIADLFRELYCLFPEKYLNKETILFSDIQDKGLVQIKEEILDRVIDETMRESYTTWFKTLESHGMKFSSCEKELKELKEIYARRNIIVHNSGIVNDIYLKNIPDSPASKGEKLIPDSQYIQHAFYIISFIVYKIMIEVLHILKNEEQNNLCECIFSLAFNELSKEEYQLSSRIYEELKNSKGCKNPYLAMSKVNYWIAQIELNGLESVKDEILSFDVSVMDQQFVMAKYLLLCEYDRALVIINKLLKTQEMSTEAVKEWPLFKSFRESDEYQTLIIQNKELFENDSYESESQNPSENGDTDTICDHICLDSEFIQQEINHEESKEEQLV